MIGTFWNLCRACPSMPVDKVNFRTIQLAYKEKNYFTGSLNIYVKKFIRIFLFFIYV